MDWTVPALVAGGGALRLILFNVRSLWFDEAITLSLATRPWREIPFWAVRMEATPPLHPLLLKPWTSLLADPLVAIRTFSWLCSILSLPLFFRLCKRLGGKHWQTAALLGVVSSFWIHLAQDGRCYAFYLLVVLAASVLYLDLLEKPDARTAVPYALVCAAGLYTHNFFLLVLATHGVWALLTKARGVWLSAAAVVGLLWLPWATSFLQQLWVWRGVTVLAVPFGSNKALEVVGELFFDPTFLGFLLGRFLVFLGAGLLLLIAAGLMRAQRRERTRLSLVLFGGPLLGALVAEVAVGKPLVQARYMVGASPFLYILLGEAVHAWGERGARFLRPALLVVAGLGTAAYFTSARLVDPHLREFSATVRRIAGSGGVVVHLEPYYYLPLRYYYLPELTHYLPPGTARLTDWEGHPGYPAVLSVEGLAGLGAVTVLDPRRKLFPGPIGRADGPTLLKLLPQPDR